MSDEAKPVEDTTEVKEVGFKDFIGSQDLKDYENTLKGKWKEEILAKESENLRASIKKELETAPVEDVATKTAREFAEYKAATEAKEARFQLKEALINKASELKADVSRVDMFLNYGDKAEEMFAKDHEYIQTAINAGIDKATKGSINTEQPKSSEEQAASDDFEARMKKSMSTY